MSSGYNSSSVDNENPLSLGLAEIALNLPTYVSLSNDRIPLRSLYLVGL